MQDPTREEMLATLQASPYAEEEGEFAIEEAIYWFASDWHGGQDSNLYAALSQSPYSPGPLAEGPEDTYLYDELEACYTSGEGA